MRECGEKRKQHESFIRVGLAKRGGERERERQAEGLSEAGDDDLNMSRRTLRDTGWNSWSKEGAPQS